MGSVQELISQTLLQCSYTSCYCEENAWLLCKAFSDSPILHQQIDNCFVVFISNPERKVPLWYQKASTSEDPSVPVVWDYHVITLFKLSTGQWLVLDIDSKLNTPIEVELYSRNTFRSDAVLKKKYHRFFRVIPAMKYLEHFASDRQHMRTESGDWLATPPTYLPICTSKSTNNLQSYISMAPTTTNNDGIYGEVLSLDQFNSRFCTQT